MHNNVCISCLVYNTQYISLLNGFEYGTSIMRTIDAIDLIHIPFTSKIYFHIQEKEPLLESLFFVTQSSFSCNKYRGNFLTLFKSTSTMLTLYE